MKRAPGCAGAFFPARFFVPSPSLSWRRFRSLRIRVRWLPPSAITRSPRRSLMPRSSRNWPSIESQVYELKVQAIKSMADDYVLEQAAKKENLTPEAYLKKHLAGKPVTETDAKLFYDQHKEIQQRYPKYDEIKDRLTQALEAQRYEQERSRLTRSTAQGSSGYRDADRAAHRGENRRSSRNRQQGCADHYRRVLGFSMSLLRPRRADPQTGPREIRRQGPPHLHGLSARASTTTRSMPHRPAAAPASRANSGNFTTRCLPINPSLRLLI